MAEADSSLTPYPNESLLPLQDNSTHTLLGTLVASPYSGDVCTLQLNSCRKKRISIFSNMIVPPAISSDIKSLLWTMMKARNATMWRTCLMKMERLLLPYYEDGSVKQQRLRRQHFTYTRGSTTAEEAKSAAAVCTCLSKARGTGVGAAAYTAMEAE